MIIDFKKISNDYHIGLTDKLRGFRNEDYLKFWVPDTNKEKSLLSLVDSLYETKKFKVQVTNVNLNLEEKKRFEKYKNIFIDSIETNVLKISINEKEYLKFINKKKFTLKVKSKKYKESLNLKNYDYSEEISEFYVLAAKKLLNGQKNINNKSIINKFDYEKENYTKGLLEFSTGDSLVLFIDNKNYRITHSILSNNKETKLSSVLLCFSKICLNKRIQEVAEHSVIELEYKLRKIESKNFSLNIQGVFLPSNSGGFFNLLNLKLREINMNFIKKYKVFPGINKDYQEINEDWKKLSFIEKKAIVDKVIKNEVLRKFNISKEDIVLKRVIGNNRLEFLLSENLKKDFNDNILFRIEEILKMEIDETIELFNIEEKDSNILRLTNSPKTV